MDKQKKYQVGMVLWTDGSRLDTGNVGAAGTKASISGEKQVFSWGKIRRFLMLNYGQFLLRWKQQKEKQEAILVLL